MGLDVERRDRCGEHVARVRIWFRAVARQSSPSSPPNGRPSVTAECVCGHAKAEHYEYVLNGRDQTRCRACDPHTGKRMPVLYAMTEGTYEAAMFEAADHDFKEAIRD